MTYPDPDVQELILHIPDIASDALATIAQWLRRFCIEELCIESRVKYRTPNARELEVTIKSLNSTEPTVATIDLDDLAIALVHLLNASGTRYLVERYEVKTGRKHILERVYEIEGLKIRYVLREES